MRREHHALWSESMGTAGELRVYGHYGRPVLVFPSSRGRAQDFEDRGMVAAVAAHIAAGRLKLYCVDSYDEASWSASWLSLEQRAEQHQRYERWVLEQVVPWITGDCGGRRDILVTGCSMGAYHAANFALKRADVFPTALCLSGVYDLSVIGWGDRGDAMYFNNPLDYVPNLDGDHMAWLRDRVELVLVCGQGQWEDTTGALSSTRRFAGALATKGLRHRLDLWGHDTPHDWPSWRAQLAHHLPLLV